jgi:N4-gp56 family major capsid protein
MPDQFTDSVAIANQVQTAYDRAAMFALRSDVVFAQVASVRPGNVTNPGNPVKFTFWDDLAVSTTALSETVDVDAVALSDSQVTVTPAEHGNAILLTLKAQTDTFLVGFDADAANIVSYNMVETIDRLARNALDLATNVTYKGQTNEASIVATNIITAALIRQQHAALAGASSRPAAGNLYWSAIHPDVAYDLKSETGDAGWLVPAAYVDTQRVYNNEIGTFGGFRFLETPRAKLNEDGGDTNVDTYTTYFLGSEALGEAVSIPPHTVIGPVTDKLMRFRPLGWYGYLGFGIVRQPSVRRIVSSSSIGDNA